MKESVTISIETFKRMDDICRDRDIELNEAYKEIERLAKAKSIITIASFGGGKEYYHTDQERVKEIIGTCFSQLESDKHNLENRVKDLKDKVKKLISKRDYLEHELEKIKSKLIFRIFG